VIDLSLSKIRTPWGARRAKPLIYIGVRRVLRRGAYSRKSLISFRCAGVRIPYYIIIELFLYNYVMPHNEMGMKTGPGRVG
jgi:hypothetical protein